MHGSNFVQWCFWYWRSGTFLPFFFFFCWETSLTSSSGVAFDLPPTCTYTDASGINKTVMVQTLCYTCNDFFCIWGRWPSQLTLLDWIRNKLSLQTSQLKKQGVESSTMLLKCSNILMVQLFGNVVFSSWVDWAMLPAEFLILAKFVRDIHDTTNCEIATTESRGSFHSPKCVKLRGFGRRVESDATTAGTIHQAACLD